MNSLEKNNGNVSDAFIMSSSGKEFDARVAENKAIGVGKRWKEMDDEEKIKTMKKLQENSEFDAISGIEAKNAGIHKHKRKGKSVVDNAIDDAITLSQEKNIADAKHSENMRSTYGDDLEKQHKIFTPKEIKKAEEDAKDAKDALVKGGSPEDRLLNQKKLDSANFILNNRDKYASLEGTTSVVDQAKIDSNIGNALGIVENKDKGVSYTQNAMYSEESKQQGTHAKLKAQGGVDAAVATDVAAETMKATRQQSATVGELSTFLQSSHGPDGGMNKKEADDMAQSIVNGSKQGGQEIAKAMMAAAAVAGRTMRAETATKTTSSMATVDAQKKAKILDEDGDVTEDGKKALSIKPGQDASSLMGKKRLGDRSQDIVNEAWQAAYDKEFENSRDPEKAKKAADATVAPYLDKNDKALKGQEFWNKQAEFQAGVFMGHNSILFGNNEIFSGAMTPDGKLTGTLSTGMSGKTDNSHTYNDSTTKMSGSKETYMNDVKENQNTKSQTVLSMFRTNNDVQKAADYEKNFDMAKFASNSQNLTSMAAAEIAHDISNATGMSPEATSILTMGAIAGGSGLAALEKITKGPIKFTDEQLDNFNQMKDDKGNTTGYTDSKGNQVANAKGYATDKHGRMVEGGVVKKAAKKALNKTRNLLSGSEPEIDPLDSANDNSSNNNESKHNDSPDDHDKPPSSDTKESITENSPTSKSIQSEIEAIEAKDSKTAGREKLSQLVEKQLKSVPKGSSEEGALRKAQSALKGTGDVSAGLLNAGGITQDVLDENGVYTHQNEKGRNIVDFDSTGEYAKADQVMELENQKVSAQAHENAMKGAQERFHDPIAPRKAPIHTVGAASDMPHLARGGGKLGLAVLATATIGSVVANADEGVVSDVSGAVFNQSSSNSPIQNAINAVVSSAEIFDPSISGVETAREIVGETVQNIQDGNYLKAAATPFSAAPRFLKKCKLPYRQLGRVELYYTKVDKWQLLFS